jgi:hypothetical protein
MTSRVVVTVYDAESEEAATEAVHHMLNGCYAPGETVYPCEGLTERNRRLRKKEGIEP